MDKKELRNYIMDKRKSMSDREVLEKSEIIAEKLFGLQEYQESQIILCYAGYNHEVLTDSIMKYSLDKGKRLALPRVSGNEMDFYYISSLKDLKKGYMSIPEPVTNDLVSRKDVSEAFMILPGTSFDLKFNRNGYGKGYYDRYTAKNQPAFMIGIAFEYQIFDEIPSEPHDRKVNYIISEVNVYGK